MPPGLGRCLPYLSRRPEGAISIIVSFASLSAYVAEGYSN